MATNYPSSLDNGTSLPYPTSTDDLSSPNLAAGQDNQNDATIAVETLVGTNATQTTPTASGNVLQATSATASEWGLLTSSNVSASTGTGSFVFATNPTLTSPTINTPTITSPSITGSLGNISTGAINASGLITASGGFSTGSVNYAALLSTIFSGQVTSYTNSGSAGGTFSYVNIGGIKLLWGFSASNLIGSNPGSNYVINFPASFFTTPPVAVPTIVSINTTWQQSVLGNAPITTSSWTFGIYSLSATGGEQVMLIVAGT